MKSCKKKYFFITVNTLLDTEVMLNVYFEKRFLMNLKTTYFQTQKQRFFEIITKSNIS